MDYTDFLNTLFEEKRKDDYIVMFTQPGNGCFFYKTMDDACRLIKNLIPSHNIYCGIGTSPKNYSPNRCSSPDISGMPALYLDIDYTTDNNAHKKKNLPPSLAAAIDLTKIGPIEPSMIVHSGNGIHAYYLFDDFWKFYSDEERQSAANLIYRLHSTVKAKALEQGWTIDSVFDLARVLRVPGTLNQKTAISIPSKIIEINDMRYTVQDFERNLVQHNVCGYPPTLKEEPAGNSNKTVTVSSNNHIQTLTNQLIFDTDCKLNLVKFDGLIDIYGPKFDCTWNNQRPDLTDTSASGYDNSLVLFALKAGWTEQECCDLMICHRLLHNHDLKFNNRQYYARTIITNQNFLKKNKKKLLSVTPDKTSTILPSSKNIIDEINSILGLKIIKLEKYLEDPDPIYYMQAMVADKKTGVFSAKDIRLGHVSTILESRLFRLKVAALTNQVIQSYKNTEWSQISQKLIDACVDREISEESTDMSQIEFWINEFLKEKEPISFEEAEDNKEAFVYQGSWYIWKDKFYRWTKNTYGCELSTKKFLLNIRRFGCEPEILNIVIHGIKTSRSVWRLPSIFKF